MKHRHIKANHNEWIHVHRAPAASSFDWSWVAYVIGGLFVVYIIMQLLPYLLLGAVGWFVLKCLSR